MSEDIKFSTSAIFGEPPKRPRGRPPGKKPEPAPLDADALAEFEERQLLQRLATLENYNRALIARGSLLEFIRFTMPDYEAADDTSRSAYQPANFHHSICKAVEKVERGEIQRLILTMPPRHGKTEIVSRRLPAFFSARNPNRHVVVATYSDFFSEGIGSNVRTTIQSPRFRFLFPQYELKQGSKAKDLMETVQGGSLKFVGRGGALTGSGAHLLIIDDLMKDAVEAGSQAIRDQAWEWFNKVAMTRLMGHKCVIIVMCMTGDTDVLMADGSTKKLADIRPGDEVATYDAGRLRSSAVVNWANQGPDEVFEVTLASGTTMKANARHPFLVDREGETEWVKLRDLRIGDKVLRAIGGSGAASHAGTRAAPSPPAAAGSACRTTTKRGGPAESGRLPVTPPIGGTCGSSSVTGSGTTSTKLSSPRRAESAPYAASRRRATSERTGAGSSASITAATPGRSGGSSATTAISPSATEKQRPCCWPQLNTYAIERDQIVSIEPAGTEDVFDIQVAETENFIANGVVSHNTRWHEDDVVGRLTDPTNPHYLEEEARSWKIINLPAIAEPGDPLGRAAGEALWPDGPDRFDLDFLKSQQRRDPFGFSALYQQRPTVEDGELFRRENIQWYEPGELPSDLTVYATSDHAVGTDRDKHDATVLLTAGVDRSGNIYLLDCFWDRAATDRVVEQMLLMAQRRKPLLWWAERGHISKSIGPFLRKRMLETGTYFTLVEVTPAANKEQRAQSIAGRVSLGMVYFPKNASWATSAVEQMLKFPHGANDDFVDALAYLGLGLGNQFGPGVRKETTRFREGTFGALKAQLRQADRDAARVRFGHA